MVRWAHTVPLKDEWALADTKQIEWQEFVRRALPKLTIAGMPKELVRAFEALVEDTTSTVDDFDEVWDWTYNWADGARVWIEL